MLVCPEVVLRVGLCNNTYEINGYVSTSEMKGSGGNKAENKISYGAESQRSRGKRSSSSMAGWRVSKAGCALSALSHLPHATLPPMHKGTWTSTEKVNNMTAW